MIDLHGNNNAGNVFRASRLGFKGGKGGLRQAERSEQLNVAGENGWFMSASASRVAR
jgi:hypothetical protein